MQKLPKLSRNDLVTFRKGYNHRVVSVVENGFTGYSSYFYYKDGTNISTGETNEYDIIKIARGDIVIFEEGEQND